MPLPHQLMVTILLAHDPFHHQLALTINLHIWLLGNRQQVQCHNLSFGQLCTCVCSHTIGGNS